jgi:UDP-GlcNAc:undecaprenyl-phosphate/decaprenyl-phosphate GlcNAc-1-phosphate transferase
MVYYLLFFLSLGLSLLLTPLAEKIAYRYRFLDIPDGRKRHRVPMPLLGGLAIYASFFLPLSFCYLSGLAGLESHQSMFFGLLVGGTLIFLAGLFDDAYGLNAPQKFIIQIAASLILIYFQDPGSVLRTIIPGLPDLPLVRYLGMALFVFWVVMLTNAINLIDGLDGLAAGICFLSTYFLMLSSIGLNRLYVLPFVTPLLGATLGFLRYNFHPARIFLGDAGSMLMGFLIAAISFQGFSKRVTFFTMLVPILLLGIPILDTVLSFGRRVLARRNPFVADREHIHHKMIRLGLTQVQTVSLLYVICAALGILSLSLVRFQSAIVLAIAVPLTILLFVGLWILGYFRPGVQTELELKEKRTDPRTHREFVLEYEIGGERRHAISLDYSKGGIFIHTQNPCDVGTEIRVWYTDPDSSKERDQRGRVVWNTAATPKSSAPGMEGMGIMFLD